MTARLYDAHVHLADPKLRPHQIEISAGYDAINLQGAVVVGTGPYDWPAVLKRCAADPRLLPAIGLHPWQVQQAPPDWKESFLSAFQQNVRLVGEIGLDGWIKGHDLKKQIPVFEFQLQYAASKDLSASIHVLKATGPLMEILRAASLPKSGFHLHAYSGPLELIEELSALGAYFSFNAGQIHHPAARQRILAVPAERLLIETDAPDFLPSQQNCEFALADPAICHPANLRAAYSAVAEIRGYTTTELAVTVEANFKRLFLKRA
jgi:TatD DNase family protein